MLENCYSNFGIRNQYWKSLYNSWGTISHQFTGLLRCIIRSSNTCDHRAIDSQLDLWSRPFLQRHRVYVEPENWNLLARLLEICYSFNHDRHSGVFYCNLEANRVSRSRIFSLASFNWLDCFIAGITSTSDLGDLFNLETVGNVLEESELHERYLQA